MQLVKAHDLDLVLTIHSYLLIEIFIDNSCNSIHLPITVNQDFFAISYLTLDFLFLFC